MALPAGQGPAVEIIYPKESHDGLRRRTKKKDDYMFRVDSFSMAEQF